LTTLGLDRTAEAEAAEAQAAGKGVS
jgi:hypothetical protein